MCIFQRAHILFIIKLVVVQGGIGTSLLKATLFFKGEALNCFQSFNRALRPDPAIFLLYPDGRRPAGRGMVAHY